MRKEPQVTDRILVGNQRYKLEICSYDDSADPAKSVPGMRKLVEMYKVPVMLGPFGTPQVWACQEINVQLKVLFNGLSASDQSRKKGNPLYIQERVPALYYGDPMAQACIDKGYKKAAVLTDINEAYLSWGKRFQQKFESLGGQVVSFESIDIKNTTDYHSIMTSMKTKNPDIIFISAYEEPTALATNHALDVGYKGKFLYTSEWGSKAEKIVGLDRIEGSLVQAMTHTFFRKYPNQDKKVFSLPSGRSIRKRTRRITCSPGFRVGRSGLDVLQGNGDQQQRDRCVCHPRSLCQSPSGRQVAAHLSEQRRLEERSDSGRARTAPGDQGRPVRACEGTAGAEGYTRIGGSMRSTVRVRREHPERT